MKSVNTSVKTAGNKPQNNFMNNRTPFIKPLITALLLCFSITGFAQNGSFSRDNMRNNGERVKAVKIAFITSKLELTAKQSEQFWVIYNNYEEDLKKIRQQYSSSPSGKSTILSDAEAMSTVEDNLDFQEAVIGLKRKYNSSFLKVISPQQLSALYATEREFKEMLLKRLQQRRNRRGQ